jgi:hypothetical protein
MTTYYWGKDSWCLRKFIHEEGDNAVNYSITFKELNGKSKALPSQSGRSTITISNHISPRLLYCFQYGHGRLTLPWGKVVTPSSILTLVQIQSQIHLKPPPHLLKPFWSSPEFALALCLRHSNGLRCVMGPRLGGMHRLLLGRVLVIAPSTIHRGGRGC